MESRPGAIPSRNARLKEAKSCPKNTNLNAKLSGITMHRNVVPRGATERTRWLDHIVFAEANLVRHAGGKMRGFVIVNEGDEVGLKESHQMERIFIYCLFILTVRSFEIRSSNGSLKQAAQPALCRSALYGRRQRPHGLVKSEVGCPLGRVPSRRHLSRKIITSDSPL